MGDRARADPASARSEPDGIPRRHRKRTDQLRPPDALDRPARRRVLDDAISREAGAMGPHAGAGDSAYLRRALAHPAVHWRAIAHHRAMLLIAPERRPYGT